MSRFPYRSGGGCGGILKKSSAPETPEAERDSIKKTVSIKQTATADLILYHGKYLLQKIINVPIGPWPLFGFLRPFFPAIKKNVVLPSENV